jgi:putative membrane protein
VRQYQAVTLRRGPDWWPTEGDEPDPRWSLANERTVLAYSRTALAFVVAGMAVAGSRNFADTPLWFAALGVPLILLGAAVAWTGGRRFLATQRAMRTGDPLGAPVAAALLPFMIALIALAGSVIAILALFITHGPARLGALRTSALANDEPRGR